MHMYVEPSQKYWKGSFIIGRGYSRGQFELLQLQLSEERGELAVKFVFAEKDRKKEFVFSNKLRPLKRHELVCCTCMGKVIEVPELLQPFARKSTKFYCDWSLLIDD